MNINKILIATSQLKYYLLLTSYAIKVTVVYIKFNIFFKMLAKMQFF